MDREQILKEIEELSGAPLIDPEKDLTIVEISKRLRMSKPGSRSRMMRLVEQGLYGTGLRYDPEVGRTVRVWWKI